jgi:hypothetical protein
MAMISHTMAGRTRFRIPARRGDRAYFRHVAAELAECDRVVRVEASARTGSVLVQHRSDLAVVASFAAQKELFAVADRLRPARGKGIGVVAPPGTSDVVGRPRLAGASALAGLGILQLARGQVLAPAITLFWYAANTIGLETLGAILHPVKNTPRDRRRMSRSSATRH